MRTLSQPRTIRYIMTLKHHNQGKILSNICQHVHGLEMRKSFTFCAARLSVEPEIGTRFNFGHACSK